MSLRVRLVVAFFLLSVVPLAAVTIYTYTNNVRALREAAEHEADLLAGELGQRMQLVTAQLSARVEHLMDVAELQAVAEEAAQQAERIVAERKADIAAPAVTTTTVVNTTHVSDQVALSLGEAALLLNNVELQGLRIRGRPPEPSDGSRAGARGAGSDGRSGEPARNPRTGRVGAPGAPPRPPDTRPPPPVAAAAGAPPVPRVPGAPLPPPVTVVTSQPDQADKMTIDMAPIRRELFRQIVPDGKFETMTPEERQRVAAEVNQRMLGVVQGIRVGARELQRRAEEAQQQSQERAKTAATRVTPPAPSRTAAPAAKPSPAADASVKRSSSLTGNRLGVKLERDGQVVRQVNAEINVPNVLATAFSTTRRDGGEVPFAVGKDGRIYARSEADRGRIEALGAVAKPDGPESVRLPEWIVVTTTDPSGTGLKLGIARPVGDSLASLRRAAARNAGFGLLFIAVALVGIVPLSGRLTHGLTRLNEGVTRLAAGDYSARVPVTAKDEIGRLALAFNQMAADVERHQRSAVEQERIRRELELGRQIQNEMLPHAPLRLGLTEIKGVSVPAREVGGDFFNYFELRSGHIAMLVGDVSGKGVGAALLMANIQASLQTRLALGQELAAIAEEIDRDIETNSPGPVYATLFVGILDPLTRRLRYVNAGHHPQFALRVDGSLERMSSTGLPVGLFAGRGYEQREVQLAAGDVVFFYTDGCVETENEADDMFGTERLEALLTSTPITGADDVLRRVEAAVTAFRGTREPFDDATMMAVKIG